MRNSTISSPADLDSRIYSIFREFQTSFIRKKKGPQNASLCKPDPLKGNLENVHFLSQKYKDILGYLIICHYVDDEVLAIYMKLDLHEFLIKNPEFYWTSVLVESRKLFLKWLIDQQTLSANAFFGNICCQIHLETCWNQIVLRFEKRIVPKRVIRRRGYKDKGTLANSSSLIRKQEAQRDEWLRETQLELERKRELRQQESALFRNYLEGIGILTDEQLLKFRIRKGDLENERTTT